MASNPNRNSPDVGRYEQHARFDLPIIPRGERGDWLPFRPIQEDAGYSLPAALNEGWTVRVFDWRFRRILAEAGQASPERLMIHRDWLDDFHREAGVDPSQSGPSSLLNIGIQYQDSLEKANDDFDDAVERAEIARVEAYDRAETTFLNALSAYEKGRSR